MKGAIASLFALVAVLPACSARTSFGIRADCIGENSFCFRMCVPYGSPSGTNEFQRISRVYSERLPDSKQEGAFPHLWLTWSSAGGDSPIDVEVYKVDAEEGTVLRPILVDENRLASHRYDAEFGRSQGTDEFAFALEGLVYRISVRGLRGPGASILSKPDDCYENRETVW